MDGDEISPKENLHPINISDAVTAPQAAVLHSITTFTGPLPPPEILREYEQIWPGFTGKHFEYIERQAAHRQAIERDVIKAKIKHEATGQFMAFTLALTTFGVAAFALYLHQLTFGGTIMSVDAVAIIGMFIYRQSIEKKGLSDRVPPKQLNTK
jgi:uncharacterized membrane protein